MRLQLPLLVSLGLGSVLPMAPAAAQASAAQERPATLLLITSDELAPAWQEFADWKTSQGIATRIVTVGSLAKAEDGPSIQERIRLCVRNHIDEHGTRFVLLGGDATPEGGPVPGGPTTYHRQEPKGIPTDIIYISPTDWDADGDGIHGRWPEDAAAITYPDGSIGLGRVPVRTAEDVAAFTAKVREYDADYPTTGQFARGMVYTNTDAPADAKVRASWDRYVDPAWDGEVMRFFYDETPWDGDGEAGSHALSSGNLVTLLNEQVAGKMHIHGHGLIDRWVLEGSYFLPKHVDALENQGAYPLITTVSCFTGQYDAPEDPSIVERMLRAPGAGSVAIYAPVRTGKPHFHKRSDFRAMVMEGKLDGTTMTMTGYWLHGLRDGMTTGQAAMAAKHDLAADARKSPNYHLCLCELNLLGDPTLRFRATAPRRPHLEAPEQLSTGERALVLATDAPGATVCVWKGDEVYEVLTTDAEGTARTTIAPATQGTVLVTLSGEGLNTVQVEVPVKSAE